MLKLIPLLLVVAATRLQAQSDLKFDKRFVESEDRWVAFEMDKDSSYPFGFIYVDAQAGLTLDYEGSFKIGPSGNFIGKKLLNNGDYKVRLQPNKVLVAFIPENRIKELAVEPIPKWLEIYKGDTNSVGRLYRWGFLYNAWDECAKALTYLDRAQKIDPKFKGLAVELAFSYNCLGEHDKAITVLKTAIEADPADAYTNKELIYAQIQSGKLMEASESCKKALLICKDTTYNGENCYNLLYSFFQKKDKENFRYWLPETKKWMAGQTQYLNSIQKMEEELLK